MWVEHLIGFLLLSIAFARNRSQINLRALLTYTPLAAFSLWMHITTGIDAIHEVDATWDEKRGRLYPPNWYKHFNLYDMHGKDEPAEAPAPDSPQVPEDNDENSPDKAEDESKAEGGAGGELFVAF